MQHSQSLQNMFNPYGYDDITKFLTSFRIFFQVEPTGYIPKDSKMGFRYGGKDYNYQDPNTFYVCDIKDNPYSAKCAIIVFKNSETEIINKFERFTKLKAFL